MTTPPEPSSSSSRAKAPSDPTRGWSTTCTTASWPTPVRSPRAGASSSPTTSARPSRAWRRRPRRRAVVASRRHRRRGDAASRGRGAHRGQHGGQPRRTHRDQRAHGVGASLGDQSSGAQRIAVALQRRQGLLHALHRLRHRQGTGADPVDERVVRRGGRQKGHARHPTSRTRRVSAWPSTSRSRTVRAISWSPSSATPTLMDFRAFLLAYEDLVRKVHSVEVRGRRLRGGHGVAHESRHDRHGAVGASTHGRSRARSSASAPWAGRPASRRPTRAPSPNWAWARYSRSPRPTTTGSSRGPSPDCS